MVYHKLAVVLLLLTGTLYAQIDPPSQMIKKRHGQAATLSWDYTPVPSFTLMYFSVKATYDLNATPVELDQVPPTSNAKTLVVQFTPQFPKFVYYVVTGIYFGTNGRVESFNSRTVGAERIGPPPN